MIGPHRPDNRDPATVWRHLEAAFAEREFPDVGWALGADWRSGDVNLTAEQYLDRAFSLARAIYGEKP